MLPIWNFIYTIFLLVGEKMENAKTVEEKELEGKVVDLLKEYGKPVSVGYVAENLKVCWSTAMGAFPLEFER